MDNEKLNKLEKQLLQNLSERCTKYSDFVQYLIKSLYKSYQEKQYGFIQHAQKINIFMDSIQQLVTQGQQIVQKIKEIKNNINGEL